MSRDHAYFKTDSGEIVRPEPSCLLVFIDETGHELLADKNYPIFGWGGCVVLASNNRSYIQSPWEQMKGKYFGGIDKPLHATSVYKPSANLSAFQLSALEEFFINQPFCRIAAVVSDKTYLSKGVEPYKATGWALSKRIEAVASPLQFSKIVMFFEESKRGSKYVNYVFPSAKAYRIVNNQKQEIPVEGYFLPKATGEAGLEVADFIIYTAGTNVQHRLKGNKNNRKNFEVIFRRVDQSFVSFIKIDSVFDMK